MARRKAVAVPITSTPLHFDMPDARWRPAYFDFQCTLLRLITSTREIALLARVYLRLEIQAIELILIIFFDLYSDQADTGRVRSRTDTYPARVEKIKLIQLSTSQS